MQCFELGLDKKFKSCKTQITTLQGGIVTKLAVTIPNLLYLTLKKQQTVILKMNLNEKALLIDITLVLLTAEIVTLSKKLNQFFQNAHYINLRT